MGCGSGSVVSCGGRVSLAPWQEGSEGQQAAVGPVALAPCDVPGALAGDHGPTGLALVRCDAASWSCVSVRRLGRPKLRPRWTFRQPGPSCPLPLPLSPSPASSPTYQCKSAFLLCLPHARPPRAAQRSFCHSWQGPFPRACPAPLRAQDLHAASAARMPPRPRPVSWFRRSCTLISMTVALGFKALEFRF